MKGFFLLFLSLATSLDNSVGGASTDMPEQLKNFILPDSETDFNSLQCGSFYIEGEGASNAPDLLEISESDSCDCCDSCTSTGRGTGRPPGCQCAAGSLPFAYRMCRSL